MTSKWRWAAAGRRTPKDSKSRIFSKNNLVLAKVDCGSNRWLLTSWLLKTMCGVLRACAQAPATYKQKPRWFEPSSKKRMHEKKQRSKHGQDGCLFDFPPPLKVAQLVRHGMAGGKMKVNVH